MCGNFGLLLLQQEESTAYTPMRPRSSSLESDLDASLHDSMREVERLGGIRVSQPIKDDVDTSSHHSLHTVTSGVSMDASYHSSEAPLPENVQAGSSEQHRPKFKARNQILDPVKILEAQIAATEIRGGQAGGISSIEYDSKDKTLTNPLKIRVRCVARKRIALSKDLALLYQRSCSYSQYRLRQAKRACNMSFIGHTRFATSSVNRVPELHPHEWVPFHSEGS